MDQEISGDHNTRDGSTFAPNNGFGKPQSPDYYREGLRPMRLTQSDA